MTVETKTEDLPPADSDKVTPSATEQPEKPKQEKIDRITALQDGIDSLSLAMFEALRGLRDAVAPESGNLGNPGNNSNNENSEPDFEEFWQNYRNGDPDTIAMVKKVTEKHPHKREDFIRIHAKVEREKDAELVQKLANTVLEKSADIDESVSSLPGMHRTRAQQMEYIEELMNKNRETAEKLEEAFNDAQQRRDLVRKFVRDNTCAALGIIEDAG